MKLKSSIVETKVGQKKDTNKKKQVKQKSFIIFSTQSVRAKVGLCPLGVKN